MIWKHTFVCINDNVPVLVSGPDMRDKGFCKDTGICLEPCLEGGQILGPLA